MHAYCISQSHQELIALALGPVIPIEQDGKEGNVEPQHVAAASASRVLDDPRPLGPVEMYEEGPCDVPQCSNHFVLKGKTCPLELKVDLPIRCW